MVLTGQASRSLGLFELRAAADKLPSDNICSDDFFQGTSSLVRRAEELSAG